MKNPARLPPALRAFRSRNYRLFFLGQSIAITGTWMTLAAMGWLVYRLTGDPYKLGLVGFFKHAPTFFLAPWGGVLVDHMSRRRVIVITQLVDAVTMAALAWLTLSGQVEVWHVFAGCVLLGITKAFEMPARQALVVDIVDDRAHLSNAIALNSTIFHGARLTGPMLAGMWIIPEYGEGGCFLVHGLCMLVATPCFGLLRPRPFTPQKEKLTLYRKLREGFVYTFGFPPVRALMLLLCVFSLLGQAYNTLLPVFASEVLNGNEATYGQLLGAAGLGAVFSAIRLAARKSVLGLGTLIFRSVMLFGVALIAFSFARNVPLALFLQVCAGMAGINVMVGSNTILQTLVEDRLRGRVMSLMGMVFMGAMPTGALLYGKVAGLIGAPYAVVLGATGCMLAGLVFRFHLPALRILVRPLYEAKGILPLQG